MIDSTVLTVVGVISGFLTLCVPRFALARVSLPASLRDFRARRGVQPRLRPETSSESLELAPKTTKTVESII